VTDPAAARAVPPPARRVFVHLGHGLDARAYHRRFLQGLETDASPYGFARAAAIGWTPVFSEDAAESTATRLLRRGSARSRAGWRAGSRRGSTC